MFLLLSTLLWANPEDTPQTPNEESPDTGDTQEDTSPAETESTEESSVPESEENVEATQEVENTPPEEKPVPPESPPNISEQDQTLTELILLLNEETPVEQRVELLNRLHAAPNVLPALKTLSLYGPISIRKEMLTLLLQHPEENITYRIVSDTFSVKSSEDIIDDTYELLSKLQTLQAAQILKERAENKDLSPQERKRVRTILEHNYPKFIAENPPKTLTADPLARAIFSGGGAILGGNIFSTLGRLGQGDDGAAVGASTGFLTGSVGSYLYTQDKSFTHGSALYFVHANTWGSILGAGFGEKMGLDENLSSMTRSLGSIGGAVYGLRTLEKDRSIDDVFESNIIVGQSIYLASSLWGLSGQYDNNYDNPGLDSFLFGTTVGLGLAEVVTPHWKPDFRTVLLAGLYGGESAFLATSLNDAGYGHEWLSPFMVSTAIVAAELQGHFQKPEPHVIATSVYGAYTGHVFGLGIGNLQNASTTLPSAIGGSLGTIAGSYLGTQSPYLDSSYLLGSSVLVAANTFGIYGIASALQSDTSNDNTLRGIRDISTGLGNMGMLYAQKKFNMTGEQTLFLTSTSLWGSYLAVTGTAIIGTEPTQLGTSTLLLSSFDLGLAAGVYALTRPNFQIRDTINPQLFAIIGGSLGSFGAYLINDSARSLAIGSLIGVGVGGYMGTKYSIDIPKTNFFNKLFISAVPQFSPQGDIGVQMQVGGVLGN